MSAGVNTAVVAVEKFFLDIIGLVLPGSVLVGGILYVVSPDALTETIKEPVGTTVVVAWVIAAYVVGHILQVIGEKMVVRVFEHMFSYVPQMGHISEQALFKEILGLPTFKFVAEHGGIPEPTDGEDGRRIVSMARNYALTLVGEVEIHTTYRLMYISLFNLG